MKFIITLLATSLFFANVSQASNCAIFVSDQSIGEIEHYDTTREVEDILLQKGYFPTRSAQAANKTLRIETDLTYNNSRGLFSMLVTFEVTTNNERQYVLTSDGGETIIDHAMAQSNFRVPARDNDLKHGFTTHSVRRGSPEQQKIQKTIVKAAKKLKQCK